MIEQSFSGKLLEISNKWRKNSRLGKKLKRRRLMSNPFKMQKKLMIFPSLRLPFLRINQKYKEMSLKWMSKKAINLEQASHG